MTNKLIKGYQRMLSKEALRARDAAESERSSTSTVVEKGQLGLPSSVKVALEVQEISFPPIRRSFSKKRSISVCQKAMGSSLKPTISSSQRQQSTATTKPDPKLNKKISDDTERLITLKNTLKSRILSGIDLSIISESKNESKLETPQQTRPQKQTENYDPPAQSKPNTFSKWANSRKPSIKKDHELSRTIEFSANEICEISLNPCLTSFHGDLTLNESALVSRMGFKDFVSKSFSLLPGKNNSTIGKVLALQRGGSREKANAAAKKIIAIQNIFAQKGIKLSTNLKELNSAKKKIVAQLLLPQRKEDSIVRFEASLEED